MLKHMSTLTFDTLRYAERLRTAGVPEQQAKAEAEALRDVLAEAMDSSLATKADLMEVKADLRLEMTGIRGELSTIKWMMGVLIAVAVANFAKQFF
jgi:hypothetical protein